MKRIFVFILSIIIIFFLIFFSVKNQFKIENIIKKIENENDLVISLKGKEEWNFYPEISYKNRISLKSKNNNLIIKDGNINIKKSYLFNSPIKSSFKSNSILFKGLEFRNSKIDSKYSNNILSLNKFTSKLIEGNLNINGLFYLDESKKIFLKGEFENIYLNRVMHQLNIANWKRINIKLSSSEFNLKTINGLGNEIIENLNGEMKISGSVFFVSTEEERFGATLLSLLADKITSLFSISEPINYLLNKFADQPSEMIGKLIFVDGVLSTDKLLLQNKKAKAIITTNIDIINNTIDGKIIFYKYNKIILETILKGNLESPEILVGSKAINKENKNEMINIKKIFENGIQSLVDNLLNSND